MSNVEKETDPETLELETKLAAVKARLSPREKDIATRAKREALREAIRSEEQRERDLDLEDRLDAARARLGAKARISALTIDGLDDSFVLVHDERAYQTWNRAMQSGKKIDRDAVYLAYAVAVIYDWNGITDWNSMVPADGAAQPAGYRENAAPTTTAGHALAERLKANRAMVTPIVNEAGKLAGLFAEARKSGG